MYTTSASIHVRFLSTNNFEGPEVEITQIQRINMKLCTNAGFLVINLLIKCTKNF
jgi:hypothetical protein